MTDDTEVISSDTSAAVTDTRPFVVGIGASAGGLEAVRALMKNVPDELPASYVVVQHISPTHRSLLTSLIDRETHLEVHELEDNTLPVVNHVYVVPPNRNVIYQEGRFRLVPPSSEPGAPKPSVDRFFKSIAEALDDHAVGIVLSGTGSDGAYGIQAIREAGGITIAQEPATAKYDGMPNSAIQTGCVDLVLSPVNIGHSLSNLSNLPQRMAKLMDAESEAPPLSEILQVVLARTRVDFRDYKPTTVLRRLERRMVALGIETQAEYALHCRENKDEVDALFRDLLISVTRFFRDPEEFEEIRLYINDLIAASEDRTIRIWIAGCATGEEAYSIAILLVEALGGLSSLPSNKIQIFATDIDENALRIARAGRYPIGAIADISREYIDKYFVLDQDSATLSQGLKNIIIFSTHNVFQDPPFMHIDLICCRNLLIYFGSILQSRTFSSFHYSLRSKGGLFLGTADSASAAPDLFSKSDYKAHLLIKRGTSRFDHRARTRNLPLTLPQGRLASGNGRQKTPAPPSNHVNALVKAMVKSLGGDAMLMSTDLEIIRIFGDLTRYISLKDGDAPQLNHMILMDSLSREIRVLTTLATKDGEAKSGTVRELVDDPTSIAKVKVYPLTHDDLMEDLFLITIRPVDDTVKTFRGAPDAPDVSEAQTSARERNLMIEDLRRELQDAQLALAHSVEQWETANEELKTTNEELQSGSEELQSVNEELETSNEELQSTNEELVTVNEALKLVTTEATDISEEFGAILDEIKVPLLIIDKNMHVSKLSKAAIELFQIARPAAQPHISQIPLPLGFPIIGEIVNDVLFKGESITRRFTSEGWPYTLSCSAYSDGKGLTRGATLVLTTSEAERELQQLMDQIPAHLLHRTADGTVLRVSRRAATALGTTVESLTGRKLQDFLTTEDANRIAANDAEFLESQRETETKLFRARRAVDAEEISVRSDNYRYVDAKSGEISIYAVGTDVSELIETERELIRTNSELQLILHHAPFYILNRDAEGTILLINKSFAEAVGETVESAIGKNVREVFSAEDADVILADDQGLLSGDVDPGRKPAELRLRESNPHMFYISQKILEGSGPDGSDSVCSVATEVTEPR